MVQDSKEQDERRKNKLMEAKVLKEV